MYKMRTGLQIPKFFFRAWIYRLHVASQRVFQTIPESYERKWNIRHKFFINRFIYHVWELLVNSFYVEPSVYINPYRGDYDRAEIKKYTDNLFKRSRVPIIINEPFNLNNKAAVLGDNRGSLLIYEFDAQNSDSIVINP